MKKELVEKLTGMVGKGVSVYLLGAACTSLFFNKFNLSQNNEVVRLEDDESEEILNIDLEDIKEYQDNSFFEDMQELILHTKQGLNIQVCVG